ncbi:MAG: CotH kinase family protein [Clostridia bacterium]|nr:CotH kinase family protein [Clostridia bacterium]
MSNKSNFFKENPAWMTVFALCAVLLVLYGFWYASHPRLSFDSMGGPAVETQIVPKGEKTLPPLAGELSYEGFVLEGWYTDETFTSRYDGDPLEKSMTVYANWIPAEHVVTFSTNQGRIVGDSAFTVTYGETLDTVPEIRHETYKLEGWYLDEACTVAYHPGVTIVTGDMQVYANMVTPTSLHGDLAAPVIYIDAKDNGVNKWEYVRCTVNIESAEDKYSRTGLKAQIRGRGNSTWEYYEKKPYRLKFDDKIDLFGMGKARDWVLLANTVDMAMLRNLTVYRMAQQFEGCKYTTDCEFVHVYLNDEYLGLYLAVEQVEEGKNRVEIGDGIDENGNPTAPEDTGFLLEIGGAGGWGDWVFNARSVKRVSIPAVVIKSPESNVTTEAQYNYIKNYVDEVQKAIAGDDFETLCELVDIQTFVDSFICTQYILAGDMGYCFFAYKEPGGKLCLGPLWDYDQAAGVSEHGGDNYKGYSAASPHTWYEKLIRNEQFRALVKESWMEHYDYIHGIPDMLYEIADTYKADIDLNYERWDGFLGSRQWRSLPKVDALKTYPEHVDYFVEWLNNRVAWIENDLGIAKD